MRLLITIIAIIAAILGLALSILPFGTIAIIPIATSFIFGFIAFKMAQKEGKNTKLVKAIFLVTIIALILNIYNSLKPNEITIDEESIEKEKISDEEMKELDAIEIE